MNRVIYSSKSDEWATPADVFEQLDREFGFTLDPCATAENHKCETYYTKEDDGLLQCWAGHRCFINPPYSEISEWVKKAYNEALYPDTICVLLIPARTDTRWFHRYILHRSEVRFVAGRIKFGGTTNAPFPSMVVIFRAAGIEA